MNNNEIIFPISEHKSLIERLKQNKQITTTRIDNEFNKYKTNDTLNSNLGYKLKVIKIETHYNIKNHPFLSFLNKKQHKLIKKQKQFNIIWLKKDII